MKMNTDSPLYPLFAAGVIVLVFCGIFTWWPKPEKAKRTCDEEAFRAQRLCQVDTKQTCVEIYEQRLKACKEARDDVPRT